MVILSIITISSLNDQHSCRSFCTSIFIDDHPNNTFSYCMLKCFSFIVTDLISSAVMQSGMCMHGTYGYVQSKCFFISFWGFCGYVWTANLLQTALVQVFTLFLCCTDGCVIHVASMIISLHIFPRLPLLVYGLLSCWLHKQNSSDWIFLSYAVCPGLLFQNHYTRFQDCSGLCSQKLLAIVLHCWVLHFLGITFLPMLVEDLLWDPHMMHLFQGTATLSHWRKVTSFFMIAFALPHRCWCVLFHIPLPFPWHEFSKCLTYLCICQYFCK